MDNENGRGPMFRFRSGLAVRLQRVDGRFVAKVSTSARRRFVADNGEPECPMYVVETAGGDVEEHYHNDTTIVEPRWMADAELQEKWETYRSLNTALRTYEITETVRAIVIKGILDEPSGEWVEEQAYYKIPVPDDPRDRKWEWVQDAAFNFAELAELSIAIRSVDDPVEAAADAAVATFRHPMGKEAAQAPGDRGTTKGTG